VGVHQVPLDIARTEGTPVGHPAPKILSFFSGEALAVNLVLTIFGQA
jgi:hypothetical protein